MKEYLKYFISILIARFLYVLIDMISLIISSYCKIILITQVINFKSLINLNNFYIWNFS